MDVAARWRRERVLLIFAVLLGVVTLHALASGGAPLPAATPHASATVAAMRAAAGPQLEPTSRTGGTAPMPMAHDPGHLCLAVLAAAIVLDLAAAAASLTRRPSWANPPRGVVHIRPRPPPRSATRLAQLCVQRT